MGSTLNLDVNGIVVPDHLSEQDLAVARQALDRRSVEVSRLAAVVESSDDAIITKTLDGIIVTWNHGAERVFGYTSDEVIGRSITLLMPPDHVNEEPAILARLRRGERVDHYETIRQHKNGSRIEISLSISPIKDADGRVIGASKIARDITRQKRTEAALRASEQRFRTTADSAPALIWMTDASKGLTWINRSWLEFSQRPMAQELGYGWTEIVHADDLDALLQLYDESFEKRQPYRLEMRLRRHDGDWRWMVNTAVPLFEDEGHLFSGYIGSMVDITEMRRAAGERENLLEAERAARNESDRLGRMKDEFLATLSHELRTPLNAVLGWTILLRRLSPGSGDYMKGLETIERNARAQARIIEDLLDMSRIVSGNVQLDVKPTNLRDVVEAGVEALRPTAAAKRLRLTTRLDPDAGLVRGDANRLQQVMWNLLTNASKFTPADGHIHVTLQRLENHVEVCVRDSGIGIPAEFLPYVFDRFRQADASITREQGGLGLGLAIVKHLVELQGGTVQARSEGTGRGSSFIVSLPLYAGSSELREQRTAEASPAEIELDSAELPSLQSIVALVVDDQLDARELINNLIANRQGDVLLAESAEQALNILQHEHVDIVITDIGMPVTDGYELMRRIRALRGPVARVPAIALTAYARTVDRQRALLAGFQMHLPKPVEPRELIAGIASLTNLSG
ncbi:MAG: PAS domain S-box protein [Pseudomonadota bacterium]